MIFHRWKEGIPKFPYIVLEDIVVHRFLQVLLPNLELGVLHVNDWICLKHREPTSNCPIGLASNVLRRGHERDHDTGSSLISWTLFSTWGFKRLKIRSDIS